jgi:hypothetical protein
LLFVTEDLREEIQKSTHDNILKDDVTLISFFCGNHGGSGCKQEWIEIYTCNYSL